MREREDRKVITQYCTWNVEWMESKINITVTFESFLHCSPPLPPCMLLLLTMPACLLLRESYWGVVHTANKLDRRWTLNVKCHKFPPIPYANIYYISCNYYYYPHFPHALFVYLPHARDLWESLWISKEGRSSCGKVIIAFRSKKIVNQSVCKKINQISARSGSYYDF